MFHLIRKDLKLLSRSRSDLVELLLMPFILIAILGFALGGLTTNEFHIEPFNVAVVDEQNHESDLEELENQLSEQGVSEEEIEVVASSAESLNPAEEFMTVLTSDEIEEWINIQQFESREAAQDSLSDEEVAGAIIIPEGFSLHLWEQVYLDEEEVSTLELEVLDFENLYTDIVRSVMTSFIDRYNLEVSIALASEGQASVTEPETGESGEVISLSTAEPVSSFQYYTIGMAVMFALYTAPALASRAYREKEQHVFGRLMISGTKPLQYLLSKFVSGTVITFSQLAILFTFSTLIFGTFQGKDLSFWIDATILTTGFSFIVGTMTSLLTSIALYSNSNATSGFFSGILVTFFAFLGGSFMPSEQLSESIRNLGNWTPNGAAMTAYLQLMQGFPFQEVMPLFLRILMMGIILLGASVILFPKRRLD